MTRVASWNVRGASKPRARGIASRIQSYDADVVLLTEAGEGSAVFGLLADTYLHVHFSNAGARQRGSAILSKRPAVVDSGMPATLCNRCVAVEADGVTFMALYGPANWSDSELHGAFWRDALAYLKQKAAKDMLVSGDFNIGHSAEDNQIGSTSAWKRSADPYYREFVNAGFVDAWRKQHGSSAREYSYFPGRRTSGKEPHGRRLDHVFVSAGLASRIKACRYDHTARELTKDRRDSDHSALLIDLTTASTC